jgi:hypothetical protein
MTPSIFLTNLHSIDVLEISVLPLSEPSASELGLWAHRSFGEYYSLLSFFMCLLPVIGAFFIIESIIFVAGFFTVTVTAFIFFLLFTV